MTKEIFRLMNALQDIDRCECGKYHVSFPEDFLVDIRSELVKTLDKCHEEANVLNDRFTEDSRIYRECLEVMDRIGPVQTFHWKTQVKEDSEKLAERQRRLEIVLMACEFKQRDIN